MKQGPVIVKRCKDPIFYFDSEEKPPMSIEEIRKLIMKKYKAPPEPYVFYKGVENKKGAVTTNDHT
jgi:hypothetical protein